MASRPEAHRAPASPRRIARFEINLRGKEHVLETNLELLKGRTLSHRKGEEIHWDFGGVRAILDEADAEIIVTDTGTVMTDERKWRIAQTLIEDLERSGFLIRQRSSGLAR